jgi:hypothetical protein
MTITDDFASVLGAQRGSQDTYLSAWNTLNRPFTNRQPLVDKLLGQISDKDYQLTLDILHSRPLADDEDGVVFLLTNAITKQFVHENFQVVHEEVIEWLWWLLHPNNRTQYTRSMMSNSPIIASRSARKACVQHRARIFMQGLREGEEALRFTEGLQTVFPHYHLLAMPQEERTLICTAIGQELVKHTSDILNPFSVFPHQHEQWTAQTWAKAVDEIWQHGCHLEEDSLEDLLRGHLI